MDQISTAKHTLPCIWMSAGLVSYKLCDRDLDCEHCPLDAALRGQRMKSPRHASFLSVSEVTNSFPDDRLFSPGHSWLQPRKTGGKLHARFGLDAFAATIIGHCCEISCPEVGVEKQRGEVLCDIDVGLGSLFVNSPVNATMVAKNEELVRNPNQLIAAPFGKGWIAEVQVDDPPQLKILSNARQVRDQTRMDLRRFRRRMALQLLADAEGIGPCLPDGGEFADLREILAGPAYLNLIREMIH